MRIIRHSSHIGLAGALVAMLVLAGSPPAVGAPTMTDLQAQIAEAETVAAAASTRALEAAAVAGAARVRADAARERAAALAAQSEAATHAWEEERARFGTAASGLYRAGSDAPLWAQALVSAEPETLLGRLAVMEQVTAASARSAAQARQAATLTTSLREQAEAAASESELLARDAEAAAATAAAEAESERAAVTAARTALDDAYDRLAAAKGTSSAREKQAHLTEKVAADAAAPGGSAGGGGGTPSVPAPAGPAPSGGGSLSPAQAQAHARGAIGGYGWAADQFGCLVSLWNRESGWRWDALNRSSGAYGIPQSLPGSKMASAGADWRTSAQTQIAWGLAYIKQRHGSPCGAWDHSQRVGWY